MDFSLSEQQEMLRDTARAFVGREMPLAPLLKPGATIQSAPYDETWAKLVALGWQGMIIPEDLGGLGMDNVDLLMIVGELGRGLGASPFIGNLFGTWALLACGAGAEARAVLAAVAAGDIRLALAAVDDALDRDGNRVAATASGDGFRLNGVSPFVIDGHGADRLVVAAKTPDGVEGFYLVDGGAAGVASAILPWRDITRQVARVNFDNAPAVQLAADGAQAWAWVRDRILMVLAAENAAGMRQVLETTVAFVGERHAFGRPVGSFQALKHGLAEIAGQTVGAEVTALYAASRLSSDAPDASHAAALAKGYSGDHYAEAARVAIQFHGAIGFTWEMPIHLYYKRALANAAMFGAPRLHRGRALDMFRAGLAGKAA